VTTTRPFPARALAVPTALILLAVVLIGKVLLEEARPAVILAPVVLATIEPTTPPTAVPTRAARIVRQEVPLCATAIPGALCVTTAPDCADELLATPGVLCRWPELGYGPH
jgi:hypothetical protein